MSSNSIVKQNYLEILKIFFISLLFLAIGSYIGVEYIPSSVRYYMNFAFFILVLFSMFAGKGRFVKSKSSMYIYAFILGVLTGATYVYYFYNLGVGIFISIVLGVVLIFGISYIIAANSTEEKIFNFAPMIFSAILVLAILEFINIFFFKFGTFDLILSVIGIAIYTFYALFIMKSVQSQCRYRVLSEGEIVNLAYSIFISFLNLLLDLLRLASILKRND